MASSSSPSKAPAVPSSASPSRAPSTSPSATPSSSTSKAPSVAPVDATSAPVSGPTVIFFEDFEKGFGFFKDGGADAAINSNNNFVWNNAGQSLRIRDNTRTSTASTDKLDVSAFSNVTVEFCYYARRNEIYRKQADAFELEYQADDGDWTSAQRYVDGTDYQNNEWHEQERVTWPTQGASMMRIRFRCDASVNNDRIYIDNVTFEGL